MSLQHPLHAVVIAGGSGTRFWPLSRRAHPKQLLKLSGDDTLLHATLLRVRDAIPSKHWWMVVGQNHAEGCKQTAPEVAPEKALVEPMARNTAPAIGLAAVHLLHQSQDPNVMMAVLPADHHVADRHAFGQALNKAALLAQSGAIVTLGIKPTRPETGFGYIQQGKPHQDVQGTFFVQRFREKPDLKTAQSFLEQGGFVWNAGIFVMQAKVYLDELQRQLPKMYQQLQHVQKAIGKANYQEILVQAYQQIEGVSIDYGVMEKATAPIAVVPVDCGWSDVGSFSALDAVITADADNNVVRGRAVVTDSKNCVVYADKKHMVGIVGMHDVVVVHTEDVTLVLPVERAQEVKDVLAKVEQKGWQEFL